MSTMAIFTKTTLTKILTSHVGSKFVSLAGFDTIYRDDEYDKFSGKYYRDTLYSRDDAGRFGECLVWSMDVMVAGGFCRNVAVESCL